MPMVRFRLSGSRDDADSVINVLHGIEDVEHVEEVDDLVPKMRDDSSSSELVDDSESSLFYIEVDAPDEVIAEVVRGVAERAARNLGAAVEFTDEF
jgi:hypothetical protein